jgi:hypothetical protein
MATYQLMRWQDIPVVVEASAAGVVHKEQLSARFQALVDLVAMKLGLAESDAYLEQWNKSARQARDGSAEEVAKAVAAEIEARYDRIREEALEAIRQDRAAKQSGDPPAQT